MTQTEKESLDVYGNPLPKKKAKKKAKKRRRR